MPKTRILIFPFDLLSHYLRCIAYADRYYEKDKYEILFLSSQRFNKYVLGSGYKTFECAQFDSEKVIECSARFDFSWLNETDIENVFLAQAEAINRYKPDLVIGDMAPSLKMAAEKCRVPYTALMNGYMTKYYAYTRKLSRTHRLYHFMKIFPANLRDSMTAFGEKAKMKKVHRPFRRIRAKYGLRNIENYLSEMEGDTNLICDLPKLFPQKGLPSNYRFTGPLIYSENRREGEWLGKLDKTKPILCVCMGSTGDWEKLRFLEDSSFSGFTIVTAGDANHVLSAPHIVAREFINLGEVLDKAVLMICHGGNGTIYHGLQKGKYMLCLTSHFEQEWNVQALERVGYGASANEFKVSDWKIKIKEALETTFQPLM